MAEDTFIEIIRKVESLVTGERNESPRQPSVNETENKLPEPVDSLVNLPNNNPPSLYLNLDGDDLPRHCTIPITQLLVAPQNHVYLIDVRRSVSAMWRLKMQLVKLERTRLSQSSSFEYGGISLFGLHF